MKAPDAATHVLDPAIVPARVLVHSQAARELGAGGADTEEHAAEGRRQKGCDGQNLHRPCRDKAT